MKKRNWAVLAGAAVLIATVNVQAREFADIYTECGLGALIAPNNAAVAAVTNVTWDLGTTAILSNATSEDTCEGSKSKTALYIHQAYPSIESDLASGEGKSLTALMEIAAIDESSQGEYAAELRRQFAQLVSVEGYAEQTAFEKSSNLHRLVFAVAG